MVLYTYKCIECEHTHELRHSIKADPTVLCPVCKCTCTRVLFPPNIVCKGKGFYRNDKHFGKVDDSGTVWGEA